MMLLATDTRTPLTWPGVRVYVGADASSVQGRRFGLLGPRMFSGAYGPFTKFLPGEVPHVRGVIDSGAFSDVRTGRVEPGAALDRQLRWERRASEKWGAPFTAEALVSDDLLIDEKWAGGKRRKERWSVCEADRAVRVTVEAAAYLASQRARLAPRSLVLACQGVDAAQYEDCARAVLAHAAPGDWLGLGGWCILGRFTSWLPEFYATLHRVLPLAAAAGLKRVHVFGVMYPPALGPLLCLTDEYGLAVSTDSSKPALDTTWKDAKKAGVRMPTWEANCVWWQTRLAQLRHGPHYRRPADARRQLRLWP